MQIYRYRLGFTQQGAELSQSYRKDYLMKRFIKKYQKKRVRKITFLKNINLFSLPQKKTGPSVETERPLRLLDMRLFKCIVWKTDNNLKNVSPALLFVFVCLFIYTANLVSVGMAHNTTYFLFYHARSAGSFSKFFTSMYFTLNFR